MLGERGSGGYPVAQRLTLWLVRRGEERDWRPEFRGVGDQDLYPTGMPRLPVLGPFGPGAGGGMLIGPHHPGFFPGGELPGHPARPPNLSPSARFDPFGAQLRDASRCEALRRMR